MQPDINFQNVLCLITGLDFIISMRIRYQFNPLEVLYIIKYDLSILDPYKCALLISDWILLADHTIRHQLSKIDGLLRHCATLLSGFHLPENSCEIIVVA